LNAWERAVTSSLPWGTSRTPKFPCAISCVALSSSLRRRPEAAADRAGHPEREQAPQQEREGGEEDHPLLEVVDAGAEGFVVLLGFQRLAVDGGGDVFDHPAVELILLHEGQQLAGLGDVPALGGAHGFVEGAVVFFVGGANRRGFLPLARIILRLELAQALLEDVFPALQFRLHGLGQAVHENGLVGIDQAVPHLGAEGRAGDHVRLGAPGLEQVLLHLEGLLMIVPSQA
jgi:hypothetical protein